LSPHPAEGRGGEAAGRSPGSRERPPGAALDAVFREHWWAAVATLTRLLGDLEAAEDAVQDACAAALAQWPDEGVPGSPRAWLIATARHKALDRLRREHRRASKEAEAMRDASPGPPPGGWPASTDDELALIFTCCHPALDPAARIALTLRCVCGVPVPEIAAAPGPARTAAWCCWPSRTAGVGTAR
jgi:RNA polymerase sigma-70 factor, ECF subfamily